MTSLATCATEVCFSRHRSTGKERDSESGNDYFGARYYGSSMGRFLSPDPSVLDYADPTNPQSLNLYSYVLNNPLNSIDPDGLKCFQVDSDGNLTGSSNAGDCATDANGNPTNNDIYIDDEQATNPYLDSNGDLLGYTNGNGQGVQADGTPWPNYGFNFGANGAGTPLNDRLGPELPITSDRSQNYQNKKLGPQKNRRNEPVHSIAGSCPAKAAIMTGQSVQ